MCTGDHGPPSCKAYFIALLWFPISGHGAQLYAGVLAILRLHQVILVSDIDPPPPPPPPPIYGKGHK